MPHYCTSFALSRRDFLKSLLASLGGLSLLPTILLSEAAISQTPIWIYSLSTSKNISPNALPIPHALPGSLMKLVASAALLEEKLISPNRKLTCNGTITRHGQTFQCPHPHGNLTIQAAIGLSCNLFFAQAAEMLSVRRFLQYAQKFQLHQPVTPATPFLFPGEITNIQASQSYVLGLNRNLQPNALQLARMSGLIAQRAIHGFHPKTWEILQNGMRMTVTRGTAADLDPDNHLHIAAKTGTTRHGHTFQSWLIGYFPVERPEYAFCLRAPVGTGKESAVPMARRYLLSRSWR